ncbi:hypothetical protein R3P38DRAFT_3193814 [Favolaschia claudopus]|uniref:Uncharacterized protein n=1 Tax=Favolaschia claudopus TaxID=2862362 RepID=A0AAW0BFD2_9AGAR
MTELLGLSKIDPDSSVIEYSTAAATWTHTQTASGSLYQTRDINATATFHFQGTSIAVNGTVLFDSPVPPLDFSPLSYDLDGAVDLTFSFNASSPVIYSSPELSLGIHTLSIRLVSNNTTLAVSGGVIIATPRAVELTSASGTHHRTIAIVAGSLGGFIVLAVLLIGFIILHRRRREDPSAIYALGPLQPNLPSTKEAFTSPKYSNHGIVFTQSNESVDVLPHIKAPVTLQETPTKAPAAPPSTAHVI